MPGRSGPVILLVIAGGSLGTLARYGVDLVMPSPGGWPLSTLTVNIVGAFALGMLVEALVRRGTDSGRRRTVRLMAGTGFLGAFTTYSALTLEAVQQFLDGQTAVATLYLAVSLVGGVLASWAGIWLGHARYRKGTP
ncbi:fluoride efflux transporter FluC [Arthrobacter monumenti]